MTFDNIYIYLNIENLDWMISFEEMILAGKIDF